MVQTSSTRAFDALFDLKHSCVSMPQAIQWLSEVHLLLWRYCGGLQVNVNHGFQGQCGGSHLRCMHLDARVQDLDADAKSMQGLRPAGLDADASQPG